MAFSRWSKVCSRPRPLEFPLPRSVNVNASATELSTLTGTRAKA